MKYGILFLLGSVAAFASLRRLLRGPADRSPAVGHVSDRWLLSQRGGDEQ